MPKLRDAVSRWTSSCPELRSLLQEHASFEAAWEACPRGSWLLHALARADERPSPRLLAGLRAGWELLGEEAPAELLPASRGRPLFEALELQLQRLREAGVDEQELAAAVRAAVGRPEGV